MTETIHLHDSWKTPLAGEFSEPYMQALKTFLQGEKAAGKRIFPKGTEWFRALDLTALEDVRVVILGQDPYHGEGQAHGLCFSVQPGVRPPPSLVNIYKELASDLGIPPVRHGFLEHWAQQGVLLLNAVLTVEHARAGSHQGKGWEAFTDAVVKALDAERENLVFLLWGSYAQKKGLLVNPRRHKVLKAPHPSPLSAYRGFMGCKHFSITNEVLQRQGQAPIDWSLPPRAEVERMLAGG